MTRARGAAAAVLLAPALVAAATYARFFGGFWLGDDFANLHRAWIAHERGDLLAQTWTQLAHAVPSAGSFYRPLMMASLALNEWLTPDRFPGWFAFNYAVHLANVVLIGALAAKLAARCGRDGLGAGALAAMFFALCPLLAEGVYWVSARSDACVTLFTLAGFYVWATARHRAVAWAGLPLLLVPALGFKESAAVLPLQMAVVALGWPRRPSAAQSIAIVASFAVVAAFLVFRASLFGSAWHVYPASGDATPLTKLWQGAVSIAPWWRGLAHATRAMASVYVIACAAALCAAAFAATDSARKLAGALLLGAIGLAAATLANLGALVSTGEGGRLAYGPVAWLALALGVALSRPQADGATRRERPRLRFSALLALAGAIASGAWVLDGELRGALAAQGGVRALTQAARAWADTRPGLTLLVVGDREGPVVTARNAQGGLVLPPVQPGALLHRVLPTLPGEIELRHAQLANGLATRLEKVRPAAFDAKNVHLMSAPDVARWPEHYACWDAGSRQLVAFDAPDPARRDQWTAAVRRGIARCGLCNARKAGRRSDIGCWIRIGPTALCPGSA